MTSLKITGLRLYKSEKLCSSTAIDQAFATGRSAIAYPLRAVWRVHEPMHAPARVLITIPKKKIRTAVGRVLLRRRTREAYRLNRLELLYPALEQAGASVDVAFVYLSKSPAPYATIEERMRQLLTTIAQSVTETPESTGNTPTDEPASETEPKTDTKADNGTEAAQNTTQQ